MRRTLFAVALISLALGAQAVPASPPQSAAAKSSAVPQRKIPCKVPENASMCYWTRGRLRVTLAQGKWRMWKVGTKRILVIFSGSKSLLPDTTDSTIAAEFPANLQRAYQAEVPRLDPLARVTPDDVYADFEVCPLEPERAGWEQAACIESAKNIFFDGSKHGYR
jgi:hypothetical protein